MNPYLSAMRPKIELLKTFQEITHPNLETHKHIFVVFYSQNGIKRTYSFCNIVYTGHKSGGHTIYG